MSGKEQHICHHPDLRPHKWNQPKPEPWTGEGNCACGARWICPICGWGSGSWPCKCEIEEAKP